jgi:hypothetical protein
LEASGEQFRSGSPESGQNETAPAFFVTMNLDGAKRRRNISPEERARRRDRMRELNAKRAWDQALPASGSTGRIRFPPHLTYPQVADTLVRDFNRFTWGRWRQRFTHDHTPFEFESCDWCERRGRRPAYWAYVKHAACFWLVNFNLELVERVLPKRPWRIITSDKHSTVWNGEGLLFDFNFQAFRIPPAECFELAARQPSSQELAPGKHRQTHLARHRREEL